MTIQRLIVGVDFSPSSNVAVARAAEIATAQGAELILVHAGTVPETPDVPASMVATRDAYLAVLNRQFASDRERLGALREDLAARGANVSQVLIDRFADDALIEAAEEFKADLIMTGTRDGAGSSRWRLGSVTAKVIRAAHTSVLCARAGDPDRGFARIVVGTDFSDTAGRALAQAVDVAAEGAVIDVVHAFHMGRWPEAVASPIDLVGDHAIHADLEAGIAARGEELLAPYRDRPVKLAFHLLLDSPHDAIRRVAVDHSADLIAIGGIGLRGIRRWLLGSVAEELLADAPCSVLVAR